MNDRGWTHTRTICLTFVRDIVVVLTVISDCGVL